MLKGTEFTNASPLIFVGFNITKVLSNINLELNLPKFTKIKMTKFKHFSKSKYFTNLSQSQNIMYCH